MTHNDAASASDAIKAALVQGLQAFMASEAKAAATDTQLEAAASTTSHPTTTWCNQSNPHC